MSIKKDRIKVYDMTCGSCEKRVENAIKKLDGVTDAKASYSGRYADVEYDSGICSMGSIKDAVKKAGYGTVKKSYFNIIGIAAIGIMILLLGANTGGFDMNEKLNNASYLVLFMVGALTSIHCVGMCGGIMLSQSISKEGTGQDESSSRLSALKPALLYNAGRIVSYTAIGGIIGALGSVFSISLGFKAALQIFAGLFMVVMGLNMAGFSLFRKLKIRLPWSSCSRGKGRAPFVVGLLNGLMPCGPLQTMQLYALGTGSMVKGALSMFLFSLGTVPLMLAFGAVSGILSKGYAKSILKFSGILVVVLGFIMGTRGFALSGINLSTLIPSGGTVTASAAAVKPEIVDGVQIIRMTADGSGYTPSVLYVQKDMPVRWVIDGKQITYCNNAVAIPSLDRQVKLKSGDNTIEFTPEDKDISFSCWMGMIRGVIKVVDNIDNVDPSKDAASVPPSGGSSCCSGPPVSSRGPGIYGDDISGVPTDRLVKRADVGDYGQNASIKGNGYEFEPLIVVAQANLKLTVNIDFNSFDDPEGEYEIVDAGTGKTVTSFTGEEGEVKFEYTFNSAGGFGILKDSTVLGVIEVVDDVSSADIEAIRDKYIR